MSQFDPSALRIVTLSKAFNAFDILSSESESDSISGPGSESPGLSGGDGGADGLSGGDDDGRSVNADCGNSGPGGGGDAPACDADDVWDIDLCTGCRLDDKAALGAVVLVLICE